MRRGVSVWAGVGLGCLLVSAAGAAHSTIGGRSAWTRTGLGAVSQPAAVGGRFVLYAEHSGSLEVVALNARDGSTAWVAAASPSDVTAGVPATLAVRARALFFLQPVAGRLGVARLVGRDVVSGRILWRSSLRTFASWPEICPDQPTALCLTGTLPSGGSAELRYDAASGRQLAPVKMTSGSVGGRELAQGLFDTGARNPEVLLSTRQGRVAWRRPLHAIFTLPRASSDGGWNLDRLSHVFVGSVGTTPRIVGNKEIIDLTHTMTAAFAIDNGHVVWRRAGFYVCTILPCAGGSESGYTSPGTVSAAGPAVGLREVMTGSATVQLSGGPPKISADASLTIQGFDPETGKTMWSFDTGRNTGLMSGQLIPARIDDDTIAMHNRTGRLVALNLRNGSSHPISSATGWCRKTITYRLSHTVYYRGGGGEYVGQAALYPCTSSGTRIATPATIPALVSRIGTDTAGIVAWTDTNAVHATRPR